ncbi:putative baseplate assembly protein [Rhodococcus aetherivorans]|uniref:putative baseplate assembly protein n=1 Tax=Rhodococcus aetherivorans TaxID=191292 RepID=UPI00366B9140
MTDIMLRCRGGERRRLVSARPGLHGLDYLEVSDDQRTLTVYFLGKAPDDLVAGNLRITGGRRITGIRVTGLDIHRSEDPERDDRMIVEVDRPGDFSCYRLDVVQVDDRGHPTTLPRDDFDPRYDGLDVDFKVGCPTELDCVPAPCPPLLTSSAPEIRYLAKDYASFLDLLLDRMALAVPGWRERHAPDLELTLLEVLAYTADHLSYFQDAVGTEAYLDTARLRTSVRRHARLVDYRMHEGCTARVWVVLDTDTDLSLDEHGLAFITDVTAVLPDAPTILTEADLEPLPDGSYDWFEPVTTGPIVVRAARSEIRFHTWGESECCLPAGTTRATLVDRLADDHKTSLLALEPGEVLILEEILGPHTGIPGDADPAHRHAVRLTTVEQGMDSLTGTPVLEVQWAAGDALPFPLCLSAIGPPPRCDLLENVSVASGNVVLADAGHTVTDDPVTVPTVSVQPPCDAGCPDPPVLIPGRFRPVLTRAPLTFRAPFDPREPASALPRTDARQAVPELAVRSSTEPSGAENDWTARPDLLDSGPDDRDLVVEIDDDGAAHLRFGDDALGRAPAAGESFTARYRTGNGPAGNLGADSLAHIVQPSPVHGATVRIRNPLPAAGGTPAEPVTDVKTFAPHAFRRDRQRAVTPADYAELAQRDFPDLVQRAAADLRWNGSWYEIRVAVDARGQAEAPPALIETVRRRLERYRRIAHDLAVVPASTIGLDIELLVCVGAQHRRSDVARALYARLGNRRLPDGSLGMFHPDVLTFGSIVAVSTLVAVAAGIPGVDNAIVTRLRRYGEPDEGAADDGALVLGPSEVARLDNDPSTPAHGVLHLDLRGGR